MKRKAFRLSTLALGLGLGLSVGLTSCKDNDLADGGNGEDGNHSEQTSQTDKYDALSRLLGALADVDSLPDGWNAEGYTEQPTVGTVADEAEPHVRYVVVPNADEADRIFSSYVGMASTGVASNHEWSQEGIGSLRFEVNNQSNLYATLYVNVKQLPTLEQLRFVPAEALGDNTIGLKPSGLYYQFGDVVKQTLNGTETYWVCVRPVSMLSKLRKSYWATLQLTDDNYKQFSDNFYLPTGLSTKKDEGERMVQNFFNVLRIIYNPSTYKDKDKSYIDKIPREEFDYTDATSISDLWELEGTWDKVRARDFTGDFKEAIGNRSVINAFYYGYNTVWVGQGDFRLYNLRVENNSALKSNSNLFNVVTPSTCWLKKASDNENRDFRKFAQAPSQVDVYIDSEKQNGYLNRYIVKIKSGAELEGKSGVDVDPANPFSKHKLANNSTIEDVVALRTNKVWTYFYALGDEVVNSKKFSGKQICLLNFEGVDNIANFSCFLSDESKGERSAYLIEPDESNMTQLILYQIYRAVDYCVFSKSKYDKNGYEKGYLYASGFKLADEEFEAYNSAMKNIYENYLKGNVEIDEANKSVTANLCGKVYKMTYDANGSKLDKYKLEKQEDNVANLRKLYLVDYLENNPKVDGFIKSREESTRSFHLKGLDHRKKLVDAVAADLEANLSIKYNFGM